MNFTAEGEAALLPAAEDTMVTVRMGVPTGEGVDTAETGRLIGFAS